MAARGYARGYGRERVIDTIVALQQLDFRTLLSGCLFIAPVAVKGYPLTTQLLGVLVETSGV